MRRKRKAARAAGGSVPASARKAIAGKLKRAAASLKAPAKKKLAKKKKPITAKAAKKKPAKKRATKAKAKPKRAKVVGRITPKGKALPPPALGLTDPGDIVRAALDNAACIVLSGEPFTLHDSKQAIGIVRDALEAIAVVDSHRPPAQVEAEMSQFVQVALDFVPQKRREDFYKEFQKALKAST